MNSQPDPTIVMAVGIAVVIVVILLRVGRASRKRRIRIERLWIGPAIFVVLAGYMIHMYPPPNSPLVYASLAGAAAVGGVAGWFRGKTTHITVEVETHELMSQVSIWGLTILLVFILARLGVRRLLSGHVPAAALTDGFLIFYVAMVVTRRAELFIRCRRLLDEARAAKARGEPVNEVVADDGGGA